MVMNPNVKQKWVRQLKSGKFKQGRGFLHQRKGAESLFDAMGVLCEIAVQEGVVERRFPVPNIAVYGGSSIGLPAKVREWAGLPVRDPVIRQVYLSNRNDKMGQSFNEIAELIDEEL